LKKGADYRLAIDDKVYEDWLAIPGIGPWTVQYSALRMGHPDIFLVADLGVKNALKKLASNKAKQAVVDADTLSPWGSYATLLLWQSLSSGDSVKINESKSRGQ